MKYIWSTIAGITLIIYRRWFGFCLVLVVLAIGFKGDIIKLIHEDRVAEQKRIDHERTVELERIKANAIVEAKRLELQAEENKRAEEKRIQEEKERQKRVAAEAERQRLAKQKENERQRLAKQKENERRENERVMLEVQKRNEENRKIEEAKMLKIRQENEQYERAENNRRFQCKHNLPEKFKDVEYCREFPRSFEGRRGMRHESWLDASCVTRSWEEWGYKRNEIIAEWKRLDCNSLIPR